MFKVFAFMLVISSLSAFAAERATVIVQVDGKERKLFLEAIYFDTNLKQTVELKSVSEDGSRTMVAMVSGGQIFESTVASLEPLSKRGPNVDRAVRSVRNQAASSCWSLLGVIASGMGYN